MTTRKNRFSKWIGGSALVLLLVLLTAAALAEDHSDQLYIQVSALSNLDYFYDHQLGCRMAGEELGVRTEYVGPADYDMTAMIAAFEQAIAKKPNGIVCVGFEDTLGPIIDKAVESAADEAVAPLQSTIDAQLQRPLIGHDGQFFFLSVIDHTLNTRIL